VRFCQSRGVEVLALVGHAVPPVLTEAGAPTGLAAARARDEAAAGLLGAVEGGGGGGGAQQPPRPPRDAAAAHGPRGSDWEPTSVHELALRLGRTALQVELAWALQRGLVVVPPTPFPDPVVAADAARLAAWKLDAAARAAVCFALVHPFARRPLFCSPTLVHRFSLEPSHMASLARMDADYRAEEAAIARESEVARERCTLTDVVRTRKSSCTGR
jgi:hypothetical protein